MNTTCNHALFAVVELYTQFLPALMPLLPQFYTVLVWSISQGMSCSAWSWVLMSPEVRLSCLTIPPPPPPPPSTDNEQLARSATQCLQVCQASGSTAGLVPCG
jgi:hypothetical protein